MCYKNPWQVGIFVQSGWVYKLIVMGWFIQDSFYNNRIKQI